MISTLGRSLDLATSHLFAGLKDEAIQHVLRRSRRLELDIGYCLFSQGEPANHFYVLLTGQIKLYRISLSGEEKVVRLVAPGNSFAECVMFMANPRYAVSAEAMEPSTVVRFECAAYLATLRENFDAARSVMTKVAERVENLLLEIELLASNSSRERLIRFLLGLVPADAGDGVTILLPARKAAIASRLSIKPESLSRLFRRLTEEGLIQVHGRRLYIPHVGRLERQILEAEPADRDLLPRGIAI